jgi:tRNA(Ile)-lysidine synthase
MLSKLEKHISENFLFLKKKKLLLATSGGIDSMVMLHLFQQLNYNMAIAHCNFQLRGDESSGDQQFIENYASTHKIPIFVTHFDTQTFAKEQKLSTQVAARELRYNWFYKLLETKKYDYLLTAHHADDNVETFIINLSRATGLEGLTGIPEQNEKIIRPLLLFSRQEIENYAQENNIVWREDSSNTSDQYLRNQIRHKIAPLLKELNPSFLESFQKTQKYLQEAQTMVKDAADIIYNQVATKKDDAIYFDLKKLKQLTNYKSYLHHWFKKYDFTAWDDIYDLVEAQSGKQVFAEKFKLLKDRDFLVLHQNKEKERVIFLIEENQKKVKIPLNLSIRQVDVISESNSSVIFVDLDRLEYPLIIRKWQEGDYFYPFGMNGKKKLSKYFKDEKMSLIEKEKVWLLCSKNDLIWIISKRLDNRFKVTENTTKILKIALLK